jgi:chromosome segregation protein
MTTLVEELGAREGHAIGDRALFAVQALEIGRLSGHVVPLTPGAFIPVSGEGDRSDSNGSGKTTFLAIASLLLGDPQWRLGNTQGDDLVNMLFDPELAGAAGRGYTPASHGYVIGFFGAVSEDTDVRTVWMRINRDGRRALGPLQVRVYEGFQGARGQTDTARLEVADTWWRDATCLVEFGLRDYASGLFGARPRVSAYVRSRGGRSSGPSLLAAEVDQFDQAAIGTELLRLCGQEELLRHDAQQRRDRAVNRKERDDVVRDDEIGEIRETSELRLLDGLDAARKALRLADEHWTDHFARQLVDGEQVLAEADTEINGKKSALTDARLTFDRCQKAVDEMPDVTSLREELDRLQTEEAEADGKVSEAEALAVMLGVELNGVTEPLRDERRRAAGWVGTAPALLREQLDVVVAEHSAHVRAHERAEDEVVRAARALEEVERSGRRDTAQALAALRAAGVATASGLLDGLVVGDQLRATLEPALVPWRDAVVVGADERGAALRALAGLPGAILISGGDTAALPESVQAPTGSGRFVERLLAHARGEVDGGISAGWDEVTVIAPLARRITGRDAAILAAREELQAAEGVRDEAAATVRQAAAAKDAAEADLVRAEAAEAAAELQAESARLQESHGEAARAAARERLARDGLRQEVWNAQTRLASVDARRDAAVNALASARKAREDATTELRELERAREDRARALRVNPFAERREEAHERAAASGLDESTLRKHAQDDLGVALQQLGIDQRTGEGAEQHDEAIAAVAARRRALLEEGRESRMPFSELAAPLTRYLDARLKRDTEQRERIVRAKRERAAQIDAYNITLAHLDLELESLAESIESSVRARLSEVSKRFDKLDRGNGGNGARLRVDVTPAGDTSDWVVKVEPQWARGPGEEPVSYRRPGNTAMKKQRTINLVLAALLDEHRAHSGGVLILDELGDSLGHQHRLSVLGAIAESAAEAGITVLATCQDTMLDAAGQFAQLVVYFRYLGGTEVVNRAPALYGYDANGSRVRVSSEAVLSGRPPA